MINEDMASLNFYNIIVHNQIWHSGNYFSYETKSRPHYGICFIVSGEIRYKMDTANILASAGDVVVLKKDARYRAVFDANSTQSILVNFYCKAPDGNSGLFSGSENTILMFRNRVDLQKKFFDILSYWTASGRECMVKSMLYAIVDGLCCSGENNAEFVRIKQAIDADIEFELKEPDLAEMCSVSVSTFQRTFKKGYGKTVSEYRNELRISRAKELLITGKHSIEEIAGRLGFCDSAYFSRCFKKTEGLSPKKYLKQYYTM